MNTGISASQITSFSEKNQNNQTVQIAPLFDSMVIQLFKLYLMARDSSGINLKNKTINDLHKMVAKGQVLHTEDQIGSTGMISVRQIPEAEKITLQRYFNPLTKHSLGQQKIAEVNTFAVHPMLTGHGLGQSLVQAAIDHAQKQNFTLAFARVAQGNDRARAIFEKQGFRHVCDTVRLNDGTPLWVLTTSF